MYRKYLALFWLFGLPVFLFAQEYLNGKVTEGKATRNIFYDRTQNYLSKNTYQSVYKVFSSKKYLLSTVTLTHDRSKSLVFIGIKSPGKTAEGSTIKYEDGKCGLIFSNTGTLDTSFSMAKTYKYLFSFSDTIRDYPVLHKIKTDESKEFQLDPLSKIRLKKNNELVKRILDNESGPEKKKERSKEEREKFNKYLLQLRDYLYVRKAMFEESVTKTRARIEKDIEVLFKTKKVFSDARRYEGDKRKGYANGSGLFMANGNYYDGYFKDGKFISGSVIINAEAFEYCGDYIYDSLNGTGWLKYDNGNFLLGIFKDGSLQDGVLYRTESDGETFFGVLKGGKRTGYGELHNTRGEMYDGEYVNGVLQKGYTKEIDPFGFITYSLIENGNKVPIDPAEGEEFFSLMTVKKQ